MHLQRGVRKLFTKNYQMKEGKGNPKLNYFSLLGLQSQMFFLKRSTTNSVSDLNPITGKVTDTTPVYQINLLPEKKNEALLRKTNWRKEGKGDCKEKNTTSSKCLCFLRLVDKFLLVDIKAYTTIPAGKMSENSKMIFFSCWEEYFFRGTVSKHWSYNPYYILRTSDFSSQNFICYLRLKSFLAVFR